MEMPIQVFIVLFVAVAAAMLIINFSTGVLNQGQQQLREFKLDCSAEAEFFIETTVVDASQVARLAESCWSRNQSQLLGDKICYILHSQSGIPADLSSAYSFLPVDWASNGRLVLPETGLTGRTLLVRFRNADQKVELSD